MVDVNQEILDKSNTRISESIKRVAKKKFKDDEAGAKSFIDSSLGLMNVATSANDALTSADLVVEAVVENMGLKQKLFADFDKIAPPETSDDTFNAMVNWGKAMGKVTVDCKDTPGFIVNRLLVPYLMEAVRMVERGDASAKDVDTAMKLGAGHPMGPFELADYVGLDTNKFIMDGWSGRYPEETLFRQSPMLNKLVADGKLGKKTGEGFYKY